MFVTSKEIGNFYEAFDLDTTDNWHDYASLISRIAEPAQDYELFSKDPKKFGLIKFFRVTDDKKMATAQNPAGQISAIKARRTAEISRGLMEKFKREQQEKTAALERLDSQFLFNELIRAAEEVRTDIQSDNLTAIQLGRRLGVGFDNLCKLIQGLKDKGNINFTKVLAKIGVNFYIKAPRKSHKEFYWILLGEFIKAAEEIKVETGSADISIHLLAVKLGLTPSKIYAETDRVKRATSINLREELQKRGITIIKSPPPKTDNGIGSSQRIDMTIASQA